MILLKIHKLLTSTSAPLQEHYAHHFLPGVHYEAVRYDLADTPERTRLLVQEATSGNASARLAQMVAAAVSQARPWEGWMRAGPWQL
jgi:hypothetical protein